MPRPAPVTTATRPSKLCSLNGARSGGDRGLEAEDATERPTEHRRALGFRHAGELLRDELAAAPEGALGVRVVVAPHQGGEPGDVPAGDRHRVVLELHVELALDVVARHQR